MKDFKGDQKEEIKSLTGKIERRIINVVLPKLPVWLKGRYLTLLSIPLSFGVALCGYLAAQFDSLWLWLSSFLIVVHWFADSFDGAIGRYRSEGVARWGFYMDHLLDYVFMAALILSYAFFFTGQERELVLLLIPLATGFMISSFLKFGATQKFDIAYFGVGPTDLRIFGIILNILIINYGTGFISYGLKYVMAILFLLLVLLIYKTQDEIRKIDRENPE